MFVDDAGHSRQTDAGTLKFLHAMQSLEDTEEFVGKLHVKPNAVVTNIDRGSLRGYTAADLDAGTVTSAGELDRIAQQVGEDLFNECGVALNCGQRFDLPVDAASTGRF